MTDEIARLVAEWMKARRAYHLFEESNFARTRSTWGPAHRIEYEKLEAAQSALMTAMEAEALGLKAEAS